LQRLIECSIEKNKQTNIVSPTHPCLKEAKLGDAREADFRFYTARTAHATLLLETSNCVILLLARF
jgi:hypothetical protein